MNLSYLKDRVQYALFSGREAEGPLAGKHTLFVVGDVPVSKIEEYVVSQKRPPCLYFGAAGWFTYNVDTVRQCLDHGLIVTIESYSPSLSMLQQYPKLHWMLPQCWHGVLDLGAVNTLKAFLKFAAEDKAAAAVLPRLLVKHDYKDFVHVVRASKLVGSTRKDYSKDVELLKVMK
jgi:hypothetical protein